MNIGALSATLSQKRRVISLNSSFSSSDPAFFGSSAVPQMGQLPGESCSTCGCIGQV